MTDQPTPDRGHDVYVHLTDAPVAKTHGLHEQVNVDMDADGQFVGVEILGATSVDVDGVRATGHASDAARTVHAAVTRGLERALRDLGVDLVGCPPSVLSGHVIKELREDGLLRDSGTTGQFIAAEIDRLLRAARGSS